MYCLTVILGNTPFRFAFKEENAARLAQSKASAGEHFLDDFGQECFSQNIAGVILENLDESKKAHVEFGLHQQRTQNAFEKAKAADPALRLGHAVNGPGIVSPFPRN